MKVGNMTLEQLKSEGYAAYKVKGEDFKELLKSEHGAAFAIGAPTYFWEKSEADRVVRVMIYVKGSGLK